MKLKSNETFKTRVTSWKGSALTFTTVPNGTLFFCGGHESCTPKAMFLSNAQTAVKYAMASLSATDDESSPKVCCFVTTRRLQLLNITQSNLSLLKAHAPKDIQDKLKIMYHQSDDVPQIRYLYGLSVSKHKKLNNQNTNLWQLPNSRYSEYWWEPQVMEYLCNRQDLVMDGIYQESIGDFHPEVFVCGSASTSLRLFSTWLAYQSIQEKS